MNQVDKMIEFLQGYEKLEDEKFRKYANEINGLVGPASVEMLNRCVNLIDPEYCYLEVGTFQGMSLIGAEMDNVVDCFGVENFAEEFHDNWNKHEPHKRSNKMILEHHLEQFNSNAEVFYQDYREFFRGREDVKGYKAQVYLYDGPHSLEHQIAGLLLAIPVLADHALVFIDDYKCENVPKSVERVLAMKRGYVREVKHWIDPYHDFNEGFVALEFKRGS